MPPQALPRPGSTPSEETPAQAAVAEAGVQQSVEFSVPAHANEVHPVVPPVRNAAPAAPPNAAPVYTLVAPLTFTVSAPVPPEDPTPDMVLLVREARVSPEWKFSGHVAAPEFALAVQRALGEGRSAAPPTANDSARPAHKKKGGFWAALKRAFGGGD